MTYLAINLGINPKNTLSSFLLIRQILLIMACLFLKIEA